MAGTSPAMTNAQYEVLRAYSFTPALAAACPTYFSVC
jgi:hypothetical protein